MSREVNDKNIKAQTWRMEGSGGSDDSGRGGQHKQDRIMCQSINDKKKESKNVELNRREDLGCTQTPTTQINQVELGI